MTHPPDSYLCEHCNKPVYFSNMLQDVDGAYYHIECYAVLMVEGIFGIDVETSDKAEAVQAMIEADLMEEALARPYQRYGTAREAMEA